MTRALFVVVLLAGCATGPHPLAGPLGARHEAGYFIVTNGDDLVVRLHTTERSHRFQGSLTPVRGALQALVLDRPALAQSVALDRGALQFDVEVARGEEGFRVRVSRDACVRFDLYFDGAPRAGRVHLGGGERAPRQVPFDRCR